MAADATAVQQATGPISPSDELRQPALKPLRSSSPKKQYLILYNFVSAILWLVVLARVVLFVPLVGFGHVYSGVGIFAKWTQTMALLEIVHAATGTSEPPKPKSSQTRTSSAPGRFTGIANLGNCGINRYRASSHFHNGYAGSKSAIAGLGHRAQLPVAG